MSIFDLAISLIIKNLKSKRNTSYTYVFRFLTRFLVARGFFLSYYKLQFNCSKSSIYFLLGLRVHFLYYFNQEHINIKVYSMQIKKKICWQNRLNMIFNTHVNKLKEEIMIEDVCTLQLTKIILVHPKCKMILMFKIFA